MGKNDADLDKWHSASESSGRKRRDRVTQHPIAKRVSPLHITKSSYYQLRFRFLGGHRNNADSSCVPALASAEDQIVAWAPQRQDGRRGFGTSMGHFLRIA